MLTYNEKDLLAGFMLDFCPTFCRDMNIHLFYSAFSSRPTSQLATNTAFVFFFPMHIFLSKTASDVSHSISKPLFQAPHNGIFYTKLKSNTD